MEINLSPRYRTLLYIASVFINAFYGVLTAQEVNLSVWFVATLAGFNAVVALVAVRNISTKKK